MQKMELEVKVLNINIENIIKKIENLGGVKVEEMNQYLYTYDLPTIYGRYIDILTELNNPESDIKYEVALERLHLLFDEIDQMASENQIEELKQITKKKSFIELLKQEDLLKVLNQNSFLEYMRQFHNNSKKWIRLRKSNKKRTLAIKHILKEDGSGIQQMKETEIEVPSITEANEILQALGLCYKSYQEKRRISYKLQNHKIDIDTWPGIPSFFEIEGESKKEIEEILNLLGYTMKDTVSCTADEIYEQNGKSMFYQRELKFE